MGQASDKAESAGIGELGHLSHTRIAVVSLLSLLALPQIWDVLASQHGVVYLFDVLVSVSAEGLAAVQIAAAPSARFVQRLASS